MKILLKSTASFAKTNKSNHWLIHHHFCCLFQPRIKKDCKFIWWPFAGLGLIMNIIKFIMQNLCQSRNIKSWVCNTVLVYSPEIVAAQFSFQVEEGESSQSEAELQQRRSEVMTGGRSAAVGLRSAGNSRHCFL